MIRLVVLLVPAVLIAGQPRYARVGEIEGRPEVQMQASDEWQPALRNTPLVDGARVRTGPGSRIEIELDDGGAFRLDAGSLAELSDYTQLSTGQRVTLISLDQGVAYFTGAAEGADSLTLAVPGAQVGIGGGARVRLEARESTSQMVALEGGFLFSSPAAEIEINEGFTVRVEPANQSRFYLNKEVTVLASDVWSEQRDKTLAAAVSVAHLGGLLYGAADLDSGAWLDTAAHGAVWKPKAAAGWAPFRNGRWEWYDALGYTWIGAEPWGWLPYHYGRWIEDEKDGWVWSPGQEAVFSPGDVYWLAGSKLVAWGPLAPGEVWDGRGRPQLYLAANTTYAPFAMDARVIDPAGYQPPQQAPAMAFVAAPPSPALSAARVKAERPPLRAGGGPPVSVLTDAAYDSAAPPPEPPPEPVGDTTYLPAPEPVIIETPGPQPYPVYYPAPVSPGIVVINPPEHERGRGRPHEPPPRPPAPVTPVRPVQPPLRPIDHPVLPPRQQPERPAPPPRRVEPPRPPAEPPREAAPARPQRVEPPRAPAERPREAAPASPQEKPAPAQKEEIVRRPAPQ